MFSADQRLLLLCLVSAFLIAFAVWSVLRSRTTPEQRERKRRLVVNRTGRMGDGVMTDVQEGIVYFSYSVRGVAYTASQDVSALGTLIPEDPAELIGPVTIKYSPRNPADSILLCEEWSGLRNRHQPLPTDTTAKGKKELYKA